MPVYRNERGQFASAQEVADAEAMRAMGDTTAPRYERQDTSTWRGRETGQREFDFGSGGGFVGGGDTDRKIAGGAETRPGRETELDNIDYGPGKLDLSDLNGEEAEIEDPTGT